MCEFTHQNLKSNCFVDFPTPVLKPSCIWLRKFSDTLRTCQQLHFQLCSLWRSVLASHPSMFLFFCNVTAEFWFISTWMIQVVPKATRLRGKNLFDIYLFNILHTLLTALTWDFAWMFWSSCWSHLNKHQGVIFVREGYV